MRKLLFSRVFFLVGLVGLVGVAASCGTTEENIAETDAWDRTQLAKDSSIVFGRIQWLEDGEEKKIGDGIFDFSIRPGLLDLEDKSRHFGIVAENGEFAWSLEPGMYVMFRINYRDPWSGNYFFTPKVGFRVPEKESIYYIGRLKVDFAPERDFLGGLSGTAKISIEDKRETDYSILTKHADVKDADIEDALMVHDERLPTPIDSTPEFQLAIQILNTLL